MHDAQRSIGGAGRRRPTVRLAVLLGFLAMAIVGCVVIDTLIVGPARTPEPSGPVPTESQVPTPTTGPTSPSTPSVPPPAGSSLVGDYRCLTLERAKERALVDGFTVGSVNYTMSGGAVDDTWVVERQTPESGAAATPGSAIDLILSSPFFVCPTPAPEP